MTKSCFRAGKQLLFSFHLIQSVQVLSQLHSLVHYRSTLFLKKGRNTHTGPPHSSRKEHPLIKAGAPTHQLSKAGAPTHQLSKEGAPKDTLFSEAPKETYLDDLTSNKCPTSTLSNNTDDTGDATHNY